MKNNRLYIFAIIFAAIFFTMNSAGAGEKVRVFEMGESGFTIEFRKTRTEMELGHSVIASDPADNAGTRIQ